MGAYLGSHELGQELTIEVVWVPAPESVNIGNATLTLVHDDGTVLGPLAADTFGANSFRVVVTPPKGGNWRVRWNSIPPGAATDDRVYVDA